MIVLQFLLKNWKYIVIAILSSTIVYLNNRVDELKSTVLEQSKTIAVQDSKIESITEGVNLCNTRVDELVSSGEALTVLINQAQVNAAKIRDQSSKTIQGILKQKVPLDCQGALDWVYNQSKETLKDWK